jgi:hypothetical protein
MSKDQALKMAIEALNKLARLGNGDSYGNSDGNCIAIKTLKAIEEALEQPAQEPVEVYGILDDGDYVSVEATKEGAIKQCDFMNKHDCNCTYKPLYTHPHQCEECENLKHDLEGYMEANKQLINKEWQGLTDDVVASIWMHEAVPMNGQDFKRVYRAIEQVLRIKNESRYT